MQASQGTGHSSRPILVRVPTENIAVGAMEPTFQAIYSRRCEEATVQSPAAAALADCRRALPPASVE